MMYEDLVKQLRYCADTTTCRNCLWKTECCPTDMQKKAADAIEELSKRVPPVPHGRLIDADALVKEVEDIAKEFPSDSIGAERFKLFAKFITEMPTIIPAEEGET